MHKFDASQFLSLSSSISFLLVPSKEMRQTIGQWLLEMEVSGSVGSGQHTADATDAASRSTRVSKS